MISIINLMHTKIKKEKEEVVKIRYYHVNENIEEKNQRFQLKS